MAHPNSRVIGAPKAIVVDTSASATALRDAIIGARPGTVITVVTAGVPQNLGTPSSPLAFTKADPGIVVVLPLAQKYILALDGGQANLHIFGGEASFDAVAGYAQNGAYALSIKNTAKVSVRGGKIGDCSHCMSLQYSSDVRIDRMVAVHQRVDFGQVVGCTRVSVSENQTLEVVKGFKTGYYGTGAEPEFNVSVSSVEGKGGRWRDGAHADGLQPREACTDYKFNNNLLNIQGAGIINADFQGYDDSGAQKLKRVEIIGNDLTVDDPTGISIKGDALTVRDNIVRSHVANSFPNKLIRVRYKNEGYGGLARAGNNVFDGSVGIGTFDTDFPGLSLSGAVNGTPEASMPIVEDARIFIPPWAPALPARPAIAFSATQVADVPQPITIFWLGYAAYTTQANVASAAAAPTVGTWLSGGRGAGKSYGAVITGYEWQWYRNGSVIKAWSSSAVYQVTGADVGAVITCVCRWNSSRGAGNASPQQVAAWNGGSVTESCSVTPQ